MHANCYSCLIAMSHEIMNNDSGIQCSKDRYAAIATLQISIHTARTIYGLRLSPSVDAYRMALNILRACLYCAFRVDLRTIVQQLTIVSVRRL